MTEVRRAGTDRPARPLMLAHRGDWTSATENSLAALLAAARRPGIDGVEFDVRAAGDGAPVVIHDVDLLRTHGHDLRVDSLPASELATLGVPSFEAVVESLPDSFFLDVELKEDVGATVVPLLARLRGDPPRNMVVSSFLPGAISTVRALQPGWPTWLIHEDLTIDVVASARVLGCTGIAAEWLSLSSSMLALLRDTGLALMTWTVPDHATLEDVLRLGPDVVCLDPLALP